MLPDVTEFCRLVLLRHPELDEAHRGRAVGAAPASLSRRGRAQVADWLRALKPITLDAIYAADVPQCDQPAQAIAAEKGVTVVLERRLRDQSMGEWQGRPWDELVHEDPDGLREFFQAFGEITPPGGESLGTAVERMLSWWTEIASDSIGKTYAIVLPGSLMSGFTAAMIGMRLSRGLSLDVPHGGIGILDVFGNGVRLTSWNPAGLAAE